MLDGTPGRTGPIAVVAHTHPSVSKGGAEIAAFNLYEGLRRLGEDAIFVAVCPSAQRNTLSLGSEREFAVIADQHRYDHFYQLSSAAIWRQLKEILLGQGVRLVSFHHFLQVGVNALRSLAAETDIPFTVTLHEFLAICNHHGQMVTRPARRLCEMATPTGCATCYPEHSREQFASRQRLIRSALLQAAGFISPSRFLAERMTAWGLPEEKFLVIENGLSLPETMPVRTRVPMEKRPWTFGYFGQITPYKGVDTLLDTIELLGRNPAVGQRVRMRIHGNLIGQEPAFLSRFEDVLAQHGFAEYYGPYNNADVFALMQGCDYVLVPSTWWENSPVVIQEAYAAGRPVICTGIGGMAEKVPDGRCGLHFRLGDAADLARVMSSAADEVLYQDLCSGVPDIAGQADMARAYLAGFSRLLPRPAPAPASPPAPELARPQRRRGRAAATV